MKRSAILLSAFLAATLLGSCHSPITSNGSDNIGSGKDPSARGTLRIKLQSPVIEAMKARTNAVVNPSQPASSASRAIGLIDSWNVRVENSDGVVLDSVASGTATAFSETTLSVPAGTGYTVYLDIFLFDVSATEPVVSGFATGVAIVAGSTTEVPIVCFPKHTQILVDGTASTAIVLKGTTTNGGTTHGGTEAWYEFTPATNFISITTSFESGTSPLWFLFDSSGDSISRSPEMASSPATNLAYVVGGTKTYLVVLNWGSTGSVAISYTATTPPADDPYEPNDTQQNAYAFTGGTTLSDCILNPANNDWYAINVANPNLELHLSFANNSSDYLAMDLIDPSGNAVLQVSTNGNPTYDYGYVALLSGTYYLHLFGISDTTTAIPYAVSWTGITPGADDACEPNDSWQAAYPLTAGTTLANCVSNPGDDDWYEIAVGASSSLVQLSFQTTSGTQPLYYTLRSATQPLMFMPAAIDPIAGTTFTRILNAGTYYVCVTNEFGAAVDEYSISLTESAAPVDDAYEENDTHAEATTLAPNTTINAISTISDLDFFSVSVSGPALELQVPWSVDSSVRDLVIDVEDDITVYDSVWIDGSSESGTLVVPLPGAGTYYIVVQTGQISSNYSLSWGVQ